MGKLLTRKIFVFSLEITVKKLKNCFSIFSAGIDEIGGNLPQVSLTPMVQYNYNVPVVFMARYEMILRGATSLQGALEGVGPENRDFFGPFAIWAQKSSFM
jgi:hypothetical protein